MNGLSQHGYSLRRLGVVVALAALLLLAGVLQNGQARASEQGLQRNGSGSQNAGPQQVAGPQQALGTAFTYQGHLSEWDQPVTGVYDFEFRMFDAASGGNQLGEVLAMNGVPVQHGLFTVQLDFGELAFSGSPCWLGISVRLAGSELAFTPLNPYQPLSPAPYALGLRPGAIISAALSGPVMTLQNFSGDGLTINGAGLASASYTSHSSNGIEVTGVLGSGLFVGRADEDGLQVQSAGEDGVKISAAVSNGMRVDSAGGNGLFVSGAGLNGVRLDTVGENGLIVSSAGFSGVRVDSAVQDGLYVLQAGDDGVAVARAGNPTKTNASSQKNGFEVLGAQDHGVFVGYADRDGVYVTEAREYGLSIGSTGLDALNVGAAGRDGLYVRSAVDDGIDVSGNDYAGWFNGRIRASSCTGCSLAAFAVNSSGQTLQPGDIVTVQGIVASEMDGASMLMQVAPAGAGMSVAGVVQGPAEVVPVSDPRPGESGQRLAPRSGAVQPGQYLTIVIYGPVQVRASAAFGPVVAGTRLAAGANGLARALQRVEVNGVLVGESVPTLGIALEALRSDGLVWVLVNPQ